MDVRIRNIGGIDEAELSLKPGITVLSGQNATNRTSFLQSIMAALGSDRSSLKSDANEGRVELVVGNETYSRTFERHGDTVQMGGNPYLDDPTAADLFAFLLGDNEPRNIVHQDGGLRELMLRPIDTEAIEDEIEQLQAERSDIDDQLAELDRQKDRLPGLEEERTRLEGEIENSREELAALEEELDDMDADIGETRAEKAELEDALEDLRSERSALEEIRYDLETEQKTLGELKAELEGVETKLEDFDEVSENRLEVLDERIDNLRSERSALERDINELGAVIGFNEDMIDDTSTQLFDTDDSDAVTDELLASESTVSCWTCGTEVETDQIETTLQHLCERRQEKVDERNEVTAELEEVRAERDELQDRRREREEIERNAQQLRDTIDHTEERIESLRENREAHVERVEELEDTVEALERDEFEEILEIHRKANELEFELDRLEDERDDIADEIEMIEDALDERDQLEARREQVSEEVADLRTKVDRIEADAVEAFNEHMADLLERLEYENVERVWIERQTETVREGRRTIEQTVFDHHVVRQAEDGSTYEDTIDHLSESERELIGIVFALAGYLVHDLSEVVPVILMDSLEAIDATRIHQLVKYFSEHVNYVLVALLSEDAAVLDDDYQYVEGI